MRCYLIESISLLSNLYKPVIVKWPRNTSYLNLILHVNSKKTFGRQIEKVKNMCFAYILTSNKMWYTNYYSTKRTFHDKKTVTPCFPTSNFTWDVPTNHYIIVLRFLCTRKSEALVVLEYTRARLTLDDFVKKES